MKFDADSISLVTTDLMSFCNTYAGGLSVIFEKSLMSYFDL